MDTASDAISKAGLVYLACPPASRKAYALQVAAAGKALFLEKPFGINTGDSARLMAQLNAITSLSLSTSIKRLALTCVTLGSMTFVMRPSVGSLKWA